MTTGARPLIFATVLAVALGLTADEVVASPNTFVVDSVADSPDDDVNDGMCLSVAGGCTVRAGVMQANATPGLQTLVLAAETYALSIAGAGEDSAATGDIDILEDLSIAGQGRDTTVLNGGGLDRILDVATGVTVDISGVTFEDGMAPGDFAFGGALNASAMAEAGANATLIDVGFRDNAANHGGAVSVVGSLTMTNALVERNTAVDGEGGGIYYLGASGGEMTLEDVEVADNEARVFAGLEALGSATMSDSTVRDNTATQAGGGIGYFGGTNLMVIEDSVISGNVVEGVGPGDHVGGGIYASDSRVQIRNTDITANSAQEGGGVAILEYDDGLSNMTIENSLLSSNTAENGGAISLGGSNTGGGVLTLRNSTISDNSASERGGGVYNYGDVRKSQAVVENSTFSANSAGTDGGAVYNTGIAGEISMTHATVTLNAADSDGDGAGGGGGVYNEDPGAQRFTLRASIIAGNMDPNGDPDCHGEFQPDGFNLVGFLGDGCPLAEDNNVIGVDPLLGALVHNGGPTKTHALATGSPAVDAVTSGCPPPATDQRGVARPAGAACDIGAFEATGEARTWGDDNCSGAPDPIDSLLTLRFDGGLAADTGECPEMGQVVEVTQTGEPGGSPHPWGDVDCSGAVNPVDSLKLLRFDGGLEVAQPAGCPKIGAVVLVSALG